MKYKMWLVGAIAILLIILSSWGKSLTLLGLNIGLPSQALGIARVIASTAPPEDQKPSYEIQHRS